MKWSRSKVAWLEALEAVAEARRRERADRVPLSEVASWARYILGAVQEEAGEAAVDRVAVRAVPLLEGLAWQAGAR